MIDRLLYYLLGVNVIYLKLFLNDMIFWINQLTTQPIASKYCFIFLSIITSRKTIRVMLAIFFLIGEVSQFVALLFCTFQSGVIV